jgi:hypothetical protein
MDMIGRFKLSDIVLVLISGIISWGSFFAEQPKRRAADSERDNILFSLLIKESPNSNNNKIITHFFKNINILKKYL